MEQMQAKIKHKWMLQERLNEYNSLITSDQARGYMILKERCWKYAWSEIKIVRFLFNHTPGAEVRSKQT